MDLTRACGLDKPITVDEVWKIAQTEMGVPPGYCLFGVDECARPLMFIGRVWAHKAHQVPLNQAESIGLFLACRAGGDAVLGWRPNALGRKLDQLLMLRRGQRAELAPAETDKFLNDALDLGLSGVTRPPARSKQASSEG